MGVGVGKKGMKGWGVWGNEAGMEGWRDRGREQVCSPHTHTHQDTHTHTCPHLQRWKRDVRRGWLFNSTSNCPYTHTHLRCIDSSTICQRCTVSGCEMMLCDM